MAWDGSGSFIRTNGTNSGGTLWTADRDAGTAILASRHDTHDEDLANGLENCVARDGQNAASADLPMGGFKHTGVGDGSALTHYPSVKQIQNTTFSNATSGGAANAYTASLSPAPGALTSGLSFVLIPNHTNTGAATLNLNSLGATPIRRGTGGTVLVAGDIVSSVPIQLYYNGSAFVILGQRFGAWNTFVPAPVGSGAMTLTPVTVASARQRTDGLETRFTTAFSGTIGGTPSTDIVITLPTTPTTASGGGGLATDGGTKVAVGWYTSGSTIIVRKYNSAVWTAGAFDLFVSGLYEG